MRRWDLLAPITGCFYLIVRTILKIQKIGFESDFFTPYRYEGQVFFGNFLRGPDWRFFWIRDWSTSPLIGESPLYYFRNIDAVHFFAGFVQWLFPVWGAAILVFSALVMSCATVWTLWIVLRKQFHGGIACVAVISGMLVPQGFLAGAQNLFLASCHLVSICSLYLFGKMWRGDGWTRRELLLLAGVVATSSMLETNLTLYLLIFLALGLLAGAVRSRPVRLPALMPVLLCLVLPFGIVRGVHWAAVSSYGLSDLMNRDLSLARQARIDGVISPDQATRTYREMGVSFFGLESVQRVGEVLRYTWESIEGRYGKIPIYILIGVLIALLWLREFSVSFFAGCFGVGILSAFLMVFVTGNAFSKLSLDRPSFLDYLIVTRIGFFCLIFFAVEKGLGRWIPARWSTVVAVMVVVFSFVGRQRHLVNERFEPFEFHHALPNVPPNSEIISNFEPSVVAVTGRSRVSMSWFDKQPTTCEHINSSKLLRMFKANGEFGKRVVYYYLVGYPPYVGPTETLDDVIKRHCIDQLPVEELYRGSFSALYKLEI